MKKRHAWILYIALGSSQLFGAEDRTETSTEIGPHHRVVETITQQVMPDGSVMEQKSTRVDLATGMHYRDGERWAESKELIEAHPNGAVAHFGAHKAAFAANLNTRGAIQVIDSDGKQFTTHVLGLAFTDTASGQSVMIALVKDSIGQIVPPNQIVYSDAFSGDVKAAVRYTYTRGGLEQDIVIQERLAHMPQEYGLNPDNTRLEVITELLDVPPATVQDRVLRAESDPARRQTMVAPDFIDQEANFGALKIAEGKAIDFQGVLTNELPVGKTYEARDGRLFLIEAVEYPAVAPALEGLPQRQAKINVRDDGIRNAGLIVPPKGAQLAVNADGLAPGGHALAVRALPPEQNVAQTSGLPYRSASSLRDSAPSERSHNLQPSRLEIGDTADRRSALRRNGSTAGRAILRPFPVAPKQQAAFDRRPMKQMASLNLRPGVLLDYVLTLTGGLTNFVFRPEVTHSVGSATTINLYGTNTIMGGTIVKYAVGGVLSFNHNIVCDTTPYHPAVFTASTDNTMGDTVTAGSPSGHYAAIAMYSSGTVTGELHDLRFSYAASAIDWAWSQERFYNLQFINCSNGLRRYHATNGPVHNVLATNIVTLFRGSDSTIHAQQVTAHNVSSFASIGGTPGKVTLTNSILLNVTNLGFGSVELDYIATNGTSWASANNRWPVSLSDFEVSVGGYHYLATNSALHDVGTTNIATNLLSEIRSLTTYAPILLTSTATVNVTFSPIASRDNDYPDLGYHYAPLDYIVRGYTLNTNVILTMTNGVAVGVDYNGVSLGIIFDTATNISIGSPTNMNRIVRAHNVQEVSSGNPGTRSMLYDIGSSGTHGDSEARFRFTEFAAMANDSYAVYTGKNWKNWEWSHCWLYNVSIPFNASKGSQTIGITNNVFEWGDCTLQRSGSSSAFHLRNNLFRRHNLDIADLNSSSTIRDNLFDTGVIYTNNTTVTHSHNAYYLMTNGTSYATNALPGLGNNLPLTSLTYQTEPYGRYGPIGRYYQPTSSLLINAGSQNATNAGLYHFTCTTNQVKETNTTVDIGPHYVALNSNGNLFDYDSDGVPDYYEDRNGNGSYESGELNWTDSDTDDDGVGDGNELLQGRNPLGGTVADTNNALNLRVFTPLK